MNEIITASMIRNFENDNPINLMGANVNVCPIINNLYAVGDLECHNFEVTLTREDMLDIFKNRGANRNLHYKKVIQMIKDIRENNWRSATGESLCFNNTRRLNDGQNRLAAFILADIKSQKFCIAINVDDYYIKHLKDSSKRSSIDRATMSVRSGSHPRQNLHDIERKVVQYAIILSPLGIKNNDNKWSVNSQTFDKFFDSATLNPIMQEICTLYDELNVPRSLKKVEPYWACIYRAYSYFYENNRTDDLRRYILMTFNPMVNTTTAYDGWAKLAKNAIDINARSLTKGLTNVKALFYALLNMYLKNFFDKIDCLQTTKSKKLTKNIKENFPFSEEINIIESTEAAAIDQIKDVRDNSPQEELTVCNN